VLFGAQVIAQYERMDRQQLAAARRGTAAV